MICLVWPRCEPFRRIEHRSATYRFDFRLIGIHIELDIRSSVGRVATAYFNPHTTHTTKTKRSTLIPSSTSQNKRLQFLRLTTMEPAPHLLFGTYCFGHVSCPSFIPSIIHYTDRAACPSLILLMMQPAALLYKPVVHAMEGSITNNSITHK